MGEPSLAEGLKQWLEDASLGYRKALPYIVSWAIWHTRNAILFQDNPSKQKVKIKPESTVTDKTKHWGFFDGASQGPSALWSRGCAICY